MAGPNYVLDKGYFPTGAVRQFRAVVASTTDKEKCTESSTAGSAVLGISQNEAAAADTKRPIDIRIMGITRAIAGVALAIGDRVRSDAEGRMTTLAAATQNQNQVGVCLTSAAAAGDHIELLLTPGAARGT